MAKRFVSRRHGSRMDRINSVAPTYAKSLMLFVGIGLCFVFGMLYMSGDDDAYVFSGRSLLQASNAKKCDGDLALPMIPKENEWDIGVRAALYMIGLGYLFLGVAISADTFMAAIEVITSKTNTVVIGGEEMEVEVWNSTVANLTLMALGSSAPEILLAVVETCALSFEAGDLGPGTIVGSAAFNLLFITAICIVSLPELEDDPETLESREIEEFGVFVITAIASLWAYLWMVLALLDDEVHVWEAIFTFLMFPILVWISWAQDQQWWGWCGAAQVSPDEDEEHSKSHLKSVTGEDGKKRRSSTSNQLAEAAVGDIDSEELKLDPEAAAKKAVQDAMRKKKKSRLEYRIQATRKMTGGKRVLPTTKKAAGAAEETLETVEEEGPPKINLGFEKAAYECDESCGSITVKVIRSGVCDKLCTVQFDTSDGDANCTDDYVSAAGTLKFEAGETEKTIEITIIDDNEWAPDKHFYVRLYGAKTDAGTAGDDIVVNTATCQITILNDDDPGTISFEAKTHQAMDTATSVDIPLVRKDGYDGNVLAFFKTTDGTAKANEDFTPLAEDYEVHFEDKAKGGVVHIDLLKNPENQNKTFTVEITQVEPEGAKLGEFPMCTVIITNDKNYQKLMEDVVAMMDDEMGKYGVGTSSWGEQFHDAMNMGGEGGEDGAEPEFMDYLMHFLSFNWKVVHAFIPPTDMGGGWYTFWISLGFIGAITVLVGDMAKMLGCCIGLDDAITAITFVALGTSLPDTFASVEATKEDETADAAITNVTGSNSVNVFLGLGLPWTAATFYHIGNGTTYKYPAGDLVFSVLVFFAFAFACIGLLFVRRKFCGGELGGPKKAAYASSAGLATAWLAYIIVSAMKTKGKI